MNGVSWEMDKYDICAISEDTCIAASFAPPGTQCSVKSLEIYHQIAISDRFQEYNRNFGKPGFDLEMPLVGHEQIDMVPI